MSLRDWVPLEMAVVDAFIATAVSNGALIGNKKAVDLGSGDGRIVKAGIAAGINTYGIEIEQELVDFSIVNGCPVNRIIHNDYFNENLGGYNFIVCWLTDPTISQALMTKCWDEMKNNTYLIWLYDSGRQFRDGIQVDTEICGIPPYPLTPPNNWKPIVEQTILGNRFFLFVR